MQIVQSAALDFLHGKPDDCYDAVITDPPFGIGKNYIDGKELCNSPEQYQEWIAPHYREMLRVLKPGGFIAIWQTQLYFRYFWEWFGDDIHIYVAAKNFVQLRKTPINYAYDPVVMRYKLPGVPLTPHKPKRGVDFFVANTAVVVRDTTRIEKAHPYPRPLDQSVQIISNFVVEGGLICDPFLGSGTIAVAALLTGRDFEGCDLSDEYVRLANKRIDTTEF